MQVKIFVDVFHHVIVPLIVRHFYISIKVFTESIDRYRKYRLFRLSPYINSKNLHYDNTWITELTVHRFCWFRGTITIHYDIIIWKKVDFQLFLSSKKNNIFSVYKTSFFTYSDCEEKIVSKLDYAKSFLSYSKIINRIFRRHQKS